MYTLYSPFAVFLNENDKNYVDPDKNRVTVYTFTTDGMEEYSFSDTIPVGIYSGFTINLSQLKL